MRRSPLGVISALTAGAISAALLGVVTPADAAVGPAPAAATADPAPSKARAPGAWTKVSTGFVAASYQASVRRTSDGLLHVVYPKNPGAPQYGHSTLTRGGALSLHSDVLSSSAWSVLDQSPALIDDPAAGLRVVFGGKRVAPPNFWADGRMYTATAVAAGPWNLPAEAVGLSTAAYASTGTAATTLADGTPLAGFSLNGTITWHAGTGSEPDESFALASGRAYDLSLVRDGANVWAAWYADGAAGGTFVRQIEPVLGPVSRAPGSARVRTGRVALAARAGGGVLVSYCAGTTSCSSLKLWQVGTSTPVTVPASSKATDVALSAGPGGRMWVAWGSKAVRAVRAVRTAPNGLTMGAVRQVALPAGAASVASVVAEGAGARADVVVNVGNGFWHTQVLPGLTLQAAPARWAHGRKKRVVFLVTEAGARIPGARVAAGGRHCTTSSAGRCAIVFPAKTRKGVLNAKASRAAFAPATRRLRIT